jgi:hypothetical protein
MYRQGEGEGTRGALSILIAALRVVAWAGRKG